MKYRKLRIAWSVWWGIGCITFVALWVLSYVWQAKGWVTTKHTSVVLDSLRGEFAVQLCSTESEVQVPPIAMKLKPIPEWENYHGDDRIIDFASFGLVLNQPDDFDPRGTYSLVAFPHWFLTAFFATLAAVPWLRLRFSLRTLLIAT